MISLSGDDTPFFNSFLHVKMYYLLWLSFLVFILNTIIIFIAKQTVA